MKAASFDYVRPNDVADVLAALAHGRGSAKLLAGGQSLGPMLNLRLARPGLLIDVSRLGALQQIEDRGPAWRIGGAVTHARLEDRRLAGAEVLSRVAAGIAYRAVRNRGTIGGSLAHADPAADWPTALVALGATAHLRSAGGTRSIAVERLMRGAFATDLGEEEIIETIDVPKLSGAGRFGYYKFCRKTGEFAEASAAAAFDPQSGTARVFLGALRPTPLPLAALAERVAREGASAMAGVAAAVTQAAPDLDAIERRMAVAVVTRALQQVLAP
jgi:aerobic carbon-monoxide dehydrogenase medium subunit